jgi:hypothetical protein
MPETEFTATTELTKWRMLSTEEIHEKFFEFASMNSTWVNDLYEIQEADKNECVVCLSMIAGAARFVSSLLSEETDDDVD